MNESDKRVRLIAKKYFYAGGGEVELEKLSLQQINPEFGKIIAKIAFGVFSKDGVTAIRAIAEKIQ
jgi:hypothetical protein